MYYIRMEQTREEAYSSLKRKKSIRRWNFAGCSPWEHLAFSLSRDEQLEVLEEYFDYEKEIFETDIDSIIHDELFYSCNDEKLAEILNLTELETGGYAEFLDGLCAIESFSDMPDSEEVEIPSEYQFKYMVCYEGENAGIDPDEGWGLFIPEKIVWIKETLYNGKRWKEIL